MSEMLLNEYYELKATLKSVGWRHIIKLFEENENFYQREVNKCIREGDFAGASKFLAQKELVPKLLTKIKQRVTQLEPKE